ncbi:MAG: HypC/HybG/HupF family hydrogenase formation chaperone [Candidatus Dormibacteria bacterium]
MCIGIPALVIEIIDAENSIVRVDMAGKIHNVNASLLTGDEAPGLGDYVLVHIGFVMGKITAEEARETRELIDGIGQDYFESTALTAT